MSTDFIYLGAALLSSAELDIYYLCIFPSIFHTLQMYYQHCSLNHLQHLAHIFVQMLTNQYEPNAEYRHFIYL